MKLLCVKARNFKNIADDCILDFVAYSKRTSEDKAHHATLYFSTHYPELLNLFNRQDDIYICRAEGKVKLENLYLNYHVRSELSKSRQFYANAFKTELNCDDLVGVKKELIEYLS